MPTDHDAIMAKQAAWKQVQKDRTMRLRAEATTASLKKAGSPLECVYTSWDDAKRAFGSCFGPNIKDVGLLFKGEPGEAVTRGFKIRSNNFDETLVEVDARRFNVVVCDPCGSNPRMMLLADVLKNAGDLFGHLGVAPDTNLYNPELDDGHVTLRIESILAPMPMPAETNRAEPPAEAGEPRSAEFAISTFSYNTFDDNQPRNLDLLCHAQGTTAATDRKGMMVRGPEAYDPTTGENRAFWFEAEETEQDICDIGTERKAESAAAVARGKSMAVAAGPFGYPRLANAYFMIQVPLKQEEPCVTRGLGEEDDWQVLDDAHCYRSGCLGGDEDDARPPVPKKMREAAAKVARVSRGSYSGPALGVLGDSLVRAAGNITVTMALVYCIDDDAAPNAETIMANDKVVKDLLNIAGDPKKLMDPSAGLTTGKPLDHHVTQAISEKLVKKVMAEAAAAAAAAPPPVAPRPGMVIM